MGFKHSRLGAASEVITSVLAGAPKEYEKNDDLYVTAFLVIMWKGFKVHIPPIARMIQILILFFSAGGAGKILVSFADGVVGYLMPEEDFAEGVYEFANAIVDPAAFSAMKQAVKTLPYST